MEHKVLSRYPLGNPHRIWRQDNFVLSTFAIGTADIRDTVETLSDCGYTMIELGWAPHEVAEGALRLCEEKGLGLLFQDFTAFGGMQQWHLEHKLTHEEAKAEADHLRPYRCVIGTYNWDEPLLQEQLDEARRQMDLFAGELPRQLQFTVAIPSYNEIYRWENDEFPAYLERYASTIDPAVLSLDFYPIGLPGYKAETQLDNSYMWCDLGQMRKTGREHRIPLWFYYQGLPMYGWEDFTFPMVRCMMYSAAMYGVKGLQQYTSVGATLTEDGKPGRFFQEQKQIHAEFRALGNTLMALENDFVFHSSDLLDACPKYAPFADSLADSRVLADRPLPGRISVGELSDAYGNRYLLVVNRDFERDAVIDLPLKKTSHIYTVSRATGRQTWQGDDNSLSLSLAKGDGQLYRIQSSDEPLATVEYRIEKG